MNFSLYKQLSEDLLKILKVLQITSDGKNPLNKDDFFCLLVDYNSSDEIQERIDNIDEKDNEFTNFIELLSREKISLRQLLGNKLYEGLKDKKSRDLQYYYFGKKTSPSPEEYKHIFQTQKPAFDHLCKKYFISPSPEAYDMFISLLSLCIYFLSGISFTKAKSISSRTHLHDSDSVQQFSSYLKKYKKVIVSGLHGTGKTTLLSSFLGEHKLDYIYLNYTDSLMQTFNQEIFSEVTDFENNLPFLKKKCSHSLLIIDGMNPKKSVFMEEVEKLASLKMCVILITTHAICPPGFHRYSAPLFTNEELFLIIPDNFPCEIAPENLFRFTGKNPYLLSLLVSTAIKSPDALYKLLKESEVFPTKAALPRFKHLPYHSTNTDFWGHASKVYTLYHNKKDYQLHRKHLKILSCFYDHEIPIDFVKYIFSEYNENVIQELTDMGYLQFIDGENKVRLSPAMANIIFFHEKPSYSDTILSHVINNIKNYLESYDVSLDFALLENILYPFAVRLGPTISQKNNPRQKNVSQNQENWWDFLYLTIEYYQMLNRPKTATSLLKLLIYPEKIHYQKSVFDVEIFRILNLWIGGDSSAFANKIDSLSSQIRYLATRDEAGNSEAQKLLPAIRYLICITLDFIISRQIQNLSLPYSKRYYYDLLQILKNIPHCIHIYSYYKRLYDILFLDIYHLDYDTLESILLDTDTKNHSKKSSQIYNICVFMCICSHKIFYERNHGSPYMTSFLILFIKAFRKLRIAIQSTRFLPKLLGNTCFASYITFQIIILSFKGCKTESLSKNDFMELLNKCITMSYNERYMCIQFFDTFF